MEIEIIPQHYKGLGRHIVHDPVSRNFALPKGKPPKTNVQHITWGPTLDQGPVGACTGFWGAHNLNTDPQRITFGQKYKMRTNEDALAYYSAATKIDPWDGEYPPDDTGSSGLAVAKALKQMGLISRFEWAFGIDGVLGAIGSTPLGIGTYWYESMFYPNKNGLVVPKGSIAGGHQYLLSGYQITGRTLSKNLFWFRNSWGVSWGNIGGFCMTVASLEKLLSQDGDAIKLTI